MGKRVLAIVQARMESARFPGKIDCDLLGKNSIEWIISRIIDSKYIDQIFVAFPDTVMNRDFVEAAQFDKGVKTYFGNMSDVFSRFLEIVTLDGADLIVRLTGDCPLVNYEIVDEVVELLVNTECDIASNTTPPIYPNGLDCSAFTKEALYRAAEMIQEPYDKEHVTSLLYRHTEFVKANVPKVPELTEKNLSIDDYRDLDYLASFMKNFDHEKGPSLIEILESLKVEENFDDRDFQSRNLGSEMNSGVKRFQYASSVILGGNSLFSKRPFLYSPLKWPTYYSKAKGVHIWDLDGNKYLDMSSMGVGACIHGYANEYVDDYVISKIKNGVASSLNNEEEILLAEKVIEIHPWASQAKFTRSGAEANDIALRIARAHTGKSQIAFSGYHGWHDWYLSANLQSRTALGELHLPGLNPSGVPKELSGISSPFSFGDIEGLNALLKTRKIAAVIMEVFRNNEPTIDYLRKVREMCDSYGAVLIFDECTSGFRENLGGIHLKYGVFPDIVTLSKALGNGYAISAVLGRKEVMKSGKDSFVSSTNWSERIGPSAALATIELFNKDPGWQRMLDFGLQVKAYWQEQARLNGLNIEIYGIPAMSKFKFNYPESNLLKTIFTENMLQYRILASTQVNLSTAHSISNLNSYFSAAAETFKLIREIIDNKNKIPHHLRFADTVCRSDFARLT